MYYNDNATLEITTTPVDLQQYLNTGNYELRNISGLNNQYADLPDEDPTVIWISNSTENAQGGVGYPILPGENLNCTIFKNGDILSRPYLYAYTKTGSATLAVLASK